MFKRIHCSTAVLTLALTAASIATPVAATASPLHLFHFHAPIADGRVSFSIQNTSELRREVKIGTEVYIVDGSKRINVTAPVGTTVYEYSKAVAHQPGALLLTVTPNAASTTLCIN